MTLTAEWTKEYCTMQYYTTKHYHFSLRRYADTDKWEVDVHRNPLVGFTPIESRIFDSEQQAKDWVAHFLG